MKEIVAITLCGCLWYVFQQWPDTYVHVIFCDVGQGDGILVSSGLTQLVIDGGPDDKIIDCLNRHIPFWDKTIEYVLATHADKDHIAGLVSLLDFYEVETFILIPSQKQSAENQALQEKVLREQKEGMRVVVPQNGQLLQITPLVSGEIYVPHILNAENTLSDRVGKQLILNTETQLWDEEASFSSSEVNENDRSIVLYLDIGTITYLFTGDIEEESQQALLKRGVIKDITVLKVSHHGAKNGSAPEFLSSTSPEIAVISSGKKNPYGHPHPSVLLLLQSVGAQVLRTDVLGTLETVTDGQHVWYVRK